MEIDNTYSLQPYKVFISLEDGGYVFGQMKKCHTVRQKKECYVLNQKKKFYVGIRDILLNLKPCKDNEAVKQYMTLFKEKQLWIANQELINDMDLYTKSYCKCRP